MCVQAIVHVRTLFLWPHQKRPTKAELILRLAAKHTHNHKDEARVKTTTRLGSKRLDKIFPTAPIDANAQEGRR